MSPTTSSFFSNVTGFSGETSLVDALVVEQIAMYGLDVMYMPRKMINFDKLTHEATKSTFEVALSMPIYIKSYSGYNNGMELLTKFGVRASDELTIVMSKSQFITFYAPFLKSYYQSINGSQTELNSLLGQTEYRPKEGDLVYFPFDGGLFEIKYVKPDGEFFQLGKNYVFEMTLERFEYSGEHFDTSIDAIDRQQATTQYYRVEFELDPSGTDTFIFNEEVRIYKINELYLASQGPQGNQGYQGPQTEDFSFYNSAGFLQDVPYLKGNVMKWNIETSSLVVGQLSDQDPSQRAAISLDTNRDKLNDVVIVGQISGATYTSVSAKTEKVAFNDDEAIQQEFDVIKVIDIGDEAPFGFL